MKRTLITLISVLLLVALVAGTVSASAASPVLIGIPDDATNGGRAIKLLESVGLTPAICTTLRSFRPRPTPSRLRWMTSAAPLSTAPMPFQPALFRPVTASPLRARPMPPAIPATPL